MEIVSSLESARFYASRGFYPIPAPWGEKGLRTQGWQKLRLTLESDLELYFSGRQNIGVILGEPDGLCDVDLDVPEAHWAWRELGLSTGFVFGHRSNPASHHFFYADPPLDTQSYDDPAAGEKKKRLIELRSRGGFFQLVPPSLYPGGLEYYEWAGARAPGAPSRVEGDMLEAAVRDSAAALLLARHAREGTRHHVFLALSGALARAGWHQERTGNLVRAVYAVLWREDAKFDDAEREVESTYDHIDGGKETTGLPTLRNLIDSEKVFKKLVEWLRLDFQEPQPKLAPLRETRAPNGHAAAAQPAPEPAPPKKLPPRAQLIGVLKNAVVRLPRQLIQECITYPGVTIVCAGNKIGKTVLAVQMCMSVANGDALFNQYETEQAPTLLFEWDDLQGKAEMQLYEARARASRPGQPFHWAVATEDPAQEPLTLADAELLPFFKDEIRRTRAKLVAFDSYSALRGVRGKSADTVKLDHSDILTFQRMGLELDCAIMLLHHDSKSSAHLDWASRGAGSFAIGAASDGIIYLTRYPELAEDEGSRLVSVRSRRMKGAEFCVRFREESKDFDLVLTGPGARDYPEIKKLHRAFPTIPFQQKEAGEALGVSIATVYRICSRLVASGVLRKEPVGWVWDPDFDRRGLNFKPREKGQTP